MLEFPVVSFFVFKKKTPALDGAFGIEAAHNGGGALQYGAELLRRVHRSQQRRHVHVSKPAGASTAADEFQCVAGGVFKPLLSNVQAQCAAGGGSHPRTTWAPTVSTELRAPARGNRPRFTRHTRTSTRAAWC